MLSQMPSDAFIMSPGCNMFFQSFLKMCTYRIIRKIDLNLRKTCITLDHLILPIYVETCCFEKIHFTKMTHIQDFITN